MNCVERIKYLLKEKNISFHKAEIDLGFGNGYIAGLRGETVRADRLVMFADYLGVTTEYLMYGKEESSTLNEAELSIAKQKLIDSVLDMTAEQVSIFQALADQVKGSGK